MAITNPVSSMSYTSKDFQTIYPELLDLARKLTYKWDPSVSNESDPGVVLLKLNAIIADKDNYNIDKNVLECFPLSVTQESNARQLFEQIGYDMSWYKSATTPMSLKWSGEIAETAITIPMFTMVSDVDNTVVYTLLGNMSATTNNSVLNATNVNLGSLVGNITLPRTGETIKIASIQGIIHDYTINGETLITLDKLDSRNRLYFTERNVAENGIFIQNANDRNSSEKQGNFSDWQKVINLSTAGFNDKVYKFGLIPNSDTCYIEFSDSIEELIGNGIYVSYITSDGLSGNTIARVIQQFYSAVDVVDPTDSTQKISLSTENTIVSNLYAVNNGADPESIDNAYRNYRKTVGTFNTLVTLRDYINAMIEAGFASNGFVCDRTDDVQDSYNITIESDNLTTQFLQVAQKESDTSRYQNNMTTDANGHVASSLIDTPIKAGTVTFTIDAVSVTDTDSDGKLYNGSTEVGVIDYKTGTFSITMASQAEKSVTVLYKSSIDKMSAFDLKMCLLQYVDDTSTLENYKKSFEIANNTDFDTTVQSYIEDQKSIQHDFVGIEANKYCMFKNKYPISCRIIPQYEPTQLQSKEVTTNICSALYQNLSSSHVDFGQAISYDDIYDVVLGADERIKSVILDEITYTTYAVYFNGTNYVEIKVSEQDSQSTVKSTEFRKDIYAKSVLAGTTPLLIPDETYAYSLDQTYQANIEDVHNIDTFTKIGKNFTNKVYEERLKQNECVRFYAPNLQDITNYSTYIDFVYNFGNSAVSADGDYKLLSGQYIVFMWKTNESDTNYTYYKYSADSIIKPNFSMTGNNEVLGITGSLFQDGGPHVVEDSELNTKISRLAGEYGGDNCLTNSKQVVIRDIVQAVAGGTNMPINYCYWVLNKSIKSGGKDVYRLFNAQSNIVSQTYILQSGEYFIRTNSAKTELEILGAGTRIVRTKTVNPSTPSAFTAWEVAKIDLTNVAEQGIAAFQDSDWFTFNGGTDTLTITEMQSVNIQEQAWIKVTDRRTTSSGGLYFSPDGAFTDSALTTVADLSNYKIEYKASDETSYSGSLPEIVLGSEGWHGMSLLNVNVSPSLAQPLFSNQSVTYYNTTSDVGTTINGGSNIMLLSSTTLTAEGGKGIDTTSVNATGESYDMSLYKYVLRADTSDIYFDDSEKFCTFKLTGSATGANAKSFTFNLPAGKYLLPLSHTNVDIDSIQVSVKKNSNTAVILTPINSADSNLKLPGKYYLVADLSTATASTVFTLYLDVVYTTAGDTSEKFVQIDKVFKYSESSNLPTDFSYADVLAQIVSLDINKKFNYTNIVADSVKIDNPLDGASFNYSNHIFNKFMINQIDEISVIVSNRSR